MDLKNIGKANFFCDETLKVYVLYASPTSWDKTYLAIINISTRSIESLLCGSSVSDRSIIAKFTNNITNAPRQLSFQGGDRTIIDECVEILSKIKETDGDNIDIQNLWTHIQYTLEDKCNITDGTILSIEGIVSLLEQYKKIYFSSSPKSDIYCGITNDLDIRTRDHIRKGEISPDSHVYAINCANNKIASKVELEMSIRDYDIGKTKTEGNGAKDNSTIVYIVKK